MAKETRYSLIDLKRDFPDDIAVVEFIFDARHSRLCSCGGTYKRLTGRRQFQCGKCRFQIAPTAGTIFHKSDTPLTLWLYAIWMFSTAKSGMSAKQLERQLGVTYKTAWRILRLIRKALPQDLRPLSGTVEMDEAFFGGHHYGGKNNKKLGRSMKKKSAVIAAVERNGEMRAEVAKNTGAFSIWLFLERYIQEGTRLLTDKSNRYDRTTRNYKRESVNHSKGEFVRGDVHVNHIETFWSHVKRSLKGTHKAISKHYLQSYLDGFVWHYNNRHSDRERFASLLSTVLHASR